MQSYSHGLSSRSSSATLLLSRHPLNDTDGTSDDINIAQGLLNDPIIPQRQSSFIGASPARPVGRSNGREANLSGPNDERQGRRANMRSSTTWTSSSGGFLSDHDDIEDRGEFLQEYNRLAKKHGVRTMVTEASGTFNGYYANTTNDKAGNWFSRNILRRSSSTLNSQTIKSKSEKLVRPKRSMSDLSFRLKLKKDALKDRDLQDLVRLCGLSLLYLPTEYAAGSLALPTCFRATAQYLVQYGSSARGVFRIPGSHNVVHALYNHYCSMDDDGAIVAGTVRYPNLPVHIKCDVHDVASTFKKFLSGLPGGILGSLRLFDAFVSIQSQLSGDPELTRTKQTKVRARLIALAIAALRSQYRRELICAVIGLLCLIGRAAETTRREDDAGRPLPTSDLMGYGSLGVIFGPLLVGDILDHYNMHLASPQRGLVVLPVGSPRSRKEKHKKSKSAGDGMSLQTHIDKISVANGVMEMLITHWRDVVRHMKDLEALKPVRGHQNLALRRSNLPMLRPSASESFMIRKPPDWDFENLSIRPMVRDRSPTPKSRQNFPRKSKGNDNGSEEGLQVKKQRSRTKPLSSHKLSGTMSMSILSPTAEETSYEEEVQRCKAVTLHEANSAKSFGTPFEENPPTTYITAPNSAKSHHRKDSPTVPYFLPLSASKRFPGGNNLSATLSGSTIRVKKPSHYNKRYAENDPEHSTEYHIEMNENAQENAQPIQHDNVRETQNIVPCSSQDHHPNILVTKGSTSTTKVSVPLTQGIVSSRVGRVVSSEPGLGPLPLLPPPNWRYNSRTLDLPQDQKRITESTNGDPLSRVSHDDDIASLAKLAQALESLDKSGDAESGLEIADLDHSGNHMCTVQEYRVTSVETLKVEHDVIAEKRVSIVTNNDEKSAEVQEQEVENLERAQVTTEKGPRSKEVADNGERKTSARRSWLEGQSRWKYNAAYTPQRHKPEHHERKVVRSAEQLGSIPAHHKRTDGADFCQNNASSPSRLLTSVTFPGPSNFPEFFPSVKTDNKSQLCQKSPDKASLISKLTRTKMRLGGIEVQSTNSIISQPDDGKVLGSIRRGSSVKALAARFDTADSKPLASRRPPQLETPKQNLLASYIQNLSSPSKSQNSMKSIKSTKSLNTPRKPMHADRSLIAQQKDSPIRVSPPRRFLRSSLSDTTPLRSVTKSCIEMRKTLSNSSTKSSGSNPMTLKPASPLQVPLLDTLDGHSRFFDLGKRYNWTGQCQTEEPSEGYVRYQSLSPIIKSKNETPFTELKASILLEKPLTLINFVESQSSSTNDHAKSRTTSPSDRDSQQTLILQQQLSRRAEDLVHLTEQLENRINPAIADLEQLKQQLANETNPAIDALTKQLTQERQKVELWKNRAEVAEKHLEELEKALLKGKRRNIWSTSSSPVESPSHLMEFSQDASTVDGRSCSLSMFEQPKHRLRDVSEDRAAVSNRIRIAIHGLDGASSDQYNDSSGESYSTVLRPRTPEVACGSFGCDGGGSERDKNASSERVRVVVVPSTAEEANDEPSDQLENHTRTMTAPAKHLRIEGSDLCMQTTIALNLDVLCALE